MANSSVIVPTNCPAELKALSPFLQRAQELKNKDPVMSYWCLYYAAQQGVKSKIRDKESRPFLFDIMQTLEVMRDEYGSTEAISNDASGAAYIENFAQKVFDMADNEDRRGAATRSTAKKFLAAANFLELLKIFDKEYVLENDEKIRYSKWKAADISKAFREGRVPQPGPADQSPTQTAFTPSSTSTAASGYPFPDQAKPSSPPPVPKEVSSLTSNSMPSSNTNSPSRTVPLPISPKTNTSALPSPSSPFQSVNRALEPPKTPEPSGTWSSAATPGWPAGKRTVPPTPNPLRSVTIADGSDTDDDNWSTSGNAFSRQASFAVPNPASPAPRRGERTDSTDSTTAVLGLHDAPSHDGDWERLPRGGQDTSRLPPLPESAENSSESGASASSWTLASHPDRPKTRRFSNSRPMGTPPNGRIGHPTSSSNGTATPPMHSNPTSPSSTTTVTPNPSFNIRKATASPPPVTGYKPPGPASTTTGQSLSPKPLSPYHAAQTPLPPTVTSSPDLPFGALPHGSTDRRSGSDRSSPDLPRDGGSHHRGGSFSNHSHTRSTSVSDMPSILNSINTPRPLDHPSLPSFPVLPSSSPTQLGSSVNLPSVPTLSAVNGLTPSAPPLPPNFPSTLPSAPGFPPPPPPPTNGIPSNRTGSPGFPTFPSSPPPPPPIIGYKAPPGLPDPHSRTGSSNSSHSIASPSPPPPPPQASAISQRSTTSAWNDSPQYQSEVESDVGVTLDPLHIAKVQKHAKFAISALNFEDIETAKMELRKALALLE